MTTALDMIPAIGARVSVRCEQMQIECTVKNVKNSWGKPRLLVSPVAGTGEQWVEMERVTLPYRRMDAGRSLVDPIPENHRTMHNLGMCERLTAGCKVCAANAGSDI